MLKTLTRFTSSFAALLSDHNSVADMEERLEDIREAMLDALEKPGPAASMNVKPTWAAITHASEVQTLWYLRSDLLRLLADRWGETAARRTMDGLTELFRGVVPKNQMPSAKRISR